MPEISNVLLQAAQQISQQIQTQQQFALQAEQLAQNIKAQQDNLALQEQRLQFERDAFAARQEAAKNAALVEAANEKRKLDLEERRAATGERNAAVGERQASVAETAQELQKALNSLRAAKLSAEIDQIDANVRKVEESLAGGRTLDAVTQRDLLNRTTASIQDLVRRSPERFVKDVPEEVISRFRGWDRPMLESLRAREASWLNENSFLQSSSNERLRAEYENRQRALNDATAYMVAMDRAIFDVRSGADPEARSEALNNALLGTTMVRSMEDALFGAASDLPEVPDLVSAVTRGDIDIKERASLLQSTLSLDLSQVPPDDIPGLAQQLNEMLLPTESVEQFQQLLISLDALGQSTVENFDMNSFTPVLVELARLRGYTKKDPR